MPPLAIYIHLLSQSVDAVDRASDAILWLCDLSDGDFSERGESIGFERNRYPYLF